jgi:crossover junction endodeoxyribonuclease RuvC
MRIIGLDPGTARLGWGVIDVVDNVETAVAYGCIETPKEDKPGARLHQIAEELTAIIEEFKPELAAVEELFFSKNQTTAMAVAGARGVITLTLHRTGVRAVKVGPSQVKLSLTGDGNADKKQMQAMVARLLNLDKVPKPDDAADGLALALVGWRFDQPVDTE